MFRDQANIFRYTHQNVLGEGITGLSPTALISKDGGAFVAPTNSVTEVDSVLAPGLYQLSLTQAECTCDLLAIQISLPNGEWPAQSFLIDMYVRTGPTAQQVWGYTTRTLTESALTAADVWTHSSRTLTASPTDISALATSSDISNAQTAIINAMPSTTGLATSSNVSNAQSAIIAAMPDVSGLSTFNPSTTDVNVSSTSISNIQSGLATSSNVSTAQTAIINAMPSTSGLATSTDVSAAQTAIINAMPSTAGLSTFNPSTDTVNLSTTSIDSIKLGLSTFDANNDSVTIKASQADTFASAADLSDAQSAIISAIPNPPSASTIADEVLNASVADRSNGSLGYAVSNISGYTDEVESKIDTVLAKLSDLPVVRSLLDRWVVDGTTLTCYDADGNILEACALTKDSNGDVTSVTAVVNN